MVMIIPPFLLPNIIPVTVAFAALPFNSQNRIIRTPEMRGKRVPKSLFFIVKNKVLGAWGRLNPYGGARRFLDGRF